MAAQTSGPIATASLFVRAGSGSGSVHALGAASLTFGRGEGCDVRLADPEVSRRHFRVEFAEASHWVVDLGSRHGTVVNGVPAKRKRLGRGDEIAVGRTRLVFAPALGEVDEAAPDARTQSRVEGRPQHPPELIGSSPGMRPVFEAIERAAPLDVTVLVVGESGTGKELVARSLHAASARASGPLTSVNCAALPRELVESELFGHEPGAFTSAVARRIGWFELAHGGTLFLDEIGELGAPAQSKLLRALEERRIRRLGGDREIEVDVRFVAATNKDLHALVDEGRFRLDLLYRLEVVRIDLPPLRERVEDIPVLAQHALDEACARCGRPAATIEPDAVAKLAAHSWPGNVRELKNAIERALIFARGVSIHAEDIEIASRTSDASRAEDPLSLDDALRAQIAKALERTGGNKARAARLLGIARSSLYHHLDRLGLR